MQRFAPINLSIDYLINLGCRIMRKMIKKGEGKGYFIKSGVHKWLVEGRSMELNGYKLTLVKG
jgi:hypothetical protein